MKLISLNDVKNAGRRISDYVINTPIISSQFLNEKLGSQIFFKLESLQNTGSFKARGAFNNLLTLKERGRLPKKVVAVGSGNHAQAVALACKMFEIEVLIYVSKITSLLKIQVARDYGAEVIVTETRREADDKAEAKAKEGYHLIHPSDDDSIIAGQGTAYLEAFEKIGEVDAVFVPCGGGGLAAAGYVVGSAQKNSPKIFAVEPELANDAAISIKNNKIHSFNDSPNTIADGARTLSVSLRTFAYLKKIDGIFASSEQEIIYWTQWLHHLLKITVEPTSALAMSGCYSWIKKNNIKDSKILIIISGGNISTETYRQIWEKDYLTKPFG